MSEATNSLSQASSAYLRSAMHQPIQWHEWGEEAFATAQRENKPILLDIGAVWCHWCHVMDRESYENADTAEIINQQFVAVKVDRDERPDVDSRYQLAVSAISGTGGWPLTVFLTPDGRPFYGGTYFPPDDRWGRPSFKKILLAIADAYRERRDEVLKSADEAMNMLANAEGFAGRQHGAFAATGRHHGAVGAAYLRREERRLRQRPQVSPSGLARSADGLVRAHPRRARRHRRDHDAHQDGAGRSLRPARGRVSSLLGRRALDRAALREDVVRQLRAAEELRSRLSGVRLRVLCARGARHCSLDGRVAE